MTEIGLLSNPLFKAREYYLWYPLVSDGYGVTDELSHGIFEANNWIGDFLAALKGKVIPIVTYLHDSRLSNLLESKKC